MNDFRPKLRIGACSWKYPEWRGVVYSAAKVIDYLHQYSRIYPTVEVDQWFRSLFSPESGVNLPNPRMFRDRFGAFLDQIPSEYAYGLEVRNKNYFNFYNQPEQSVRNL